jgi:hypothetical protein
LSDADLLRWKSIENLNNVKLGVNLGDVKRNIVH